MNGLNNIVYVHQELLQGLVGIHSMIKKLLMLWIACTRLLGTVVLLLADPFIHSSRKQLITLSTPRDLP